MPPPYIPFASISSYRPSCLQCTLYQRGQIKRGYIRDKNPAAIASGLRHTQLKTCNTTIVRQIRLLPKHIYAHVARQPCHSGKNWDLEQCVEHHSMALMSYFMRAPIRRTQTKDSMNSYRLHLANSNTIVTTEE
jgi:hypothetical protein